MDDIEKLFIQDDSTFTVYVVEQQFVVGRGLEYFKNILIPPIILRLKSK